MARRFAEAVMRGEREGTAEPIIALFDEECELSSVVHQAPLRGVTGARKFWQDYLASFRIVRSHFEHVAERDGLAVLEWETDATLASGQDIHYRGVSLVEHTDGRVQRFRTYYDPRPLAGRHARS